jgi:dolichol-phosphate mannosyltransferase
VRSSAAEHYLHTVGVTGSIPVAPTTQFKDLAVRVVGKSSKNYYSCNNPGLGLIKKGNPEDKKKCALFSTEADSMSIDPNFPMPDAKKRIAVVIPCFRVTQHILSVIDEIGAAVWRIYAVDDKCPDQSGDYIKTNSRDPRVVVLYNQVNLGVGGAMITGFRQAMADGCDIVVKVDGDGQMDPTFVSKLIRPILAGTADYAKGNRFWNVSDIQAMPGMRLFGNAALSFLTKFSSGYWTIFDPTNGFIAIHAAVLRVVPLDKVSQRYFFESDLLFWLSTVRAVVVDVPMAAVYRGETSNLKIGSIIGPFLWGNFRNFLKRLFYNYFLRDFSVASIELLLGVCFFAFGLTFGLANWIEGALRGEAATAGTVMLAALPIIIGLNLLLSFLHFDVQNIPRQPIHPFLLGMDNPQPIAARKP